MNGDGTEKVRLTEDREKNFYPVWAENGRWIYFQRNDDIYRMRSDGSDPQVVVRDGFSFDLSEDGQKIIHVRKVQGIHRILIRDLESEQIEELIPARVPEFMGKKLMYPTLSPDGRWLAFSSDFPRAWTIHIVSIEGEDLREFVYGCMPRFRPDGKRIAWISSGSHDVFVGTLDGTTKRPFEKSIPGRPHCYYPRWSDNGEYIVFAASPQVDPHTNDYEIYIKSTQGGDAVRLTFHPQSDIWPDLFLPGH